MSRPSLRRPRREGPIFLRSETVVIPGTGLTVYSMAVSQPVT